MSTSASSRSSESTARRSPSRSGTATSPGGSYGSSPAPSPSREGCSTPPGASASARRRRSHPSTSTSASRDRSSMWDQPSSKPTDARGRAATSARSWARLRGQHRRGRQPQVLDAPDSLVVRRLHEALLSATGSLRSWRAARVHEARQAAGRAGEPAPGAASSSLGKGSCEHRWRCLAPLTGSEAPARGRRRERHFRGVLACRGWSHPRL